MNDRPLRILGSIGLAVSGALGLAGSFAPTATLRGLAWGLDGTALVMACAVLTLLFFRRGQDLVAAGFLVFAVGEGLVVACSAMELNASIPLFGAGTGLWAMALFLISAPRVFPLPVRLLGLAAGVLFAVVALQIFAGAQLTPLSHPLPFNAYPVFVATFAGWISTLLRPSPGVSH